MNFIDETLAKPTPFRLADVNLPRRENYYPSPVDWADEILYFLLPDRFSDGKEMSRKMLDRNNRWEARPKMAGDQTWKWEKWVASGENHFQGGTIKGIESKLSYLKKLGITAIWVGPVFKQRGHLDTYHGYGIQDFLDVDPRFGTRQDLVDLIKAAHQNDIRIILDIIFNHSGENFYYAPDTKGKVCSPPVDGIHEAEYTHGQYQSINWVDKDGNAISHIQDKEDGIWPVELQNNDYFTRAGTACDIGYGRIDDPHAVHKRTDFFNLRDFDLSKGDLLTHLAKVYQYWIALTDCDGFRIDTMKHVTWDQAKNFCGSIKEFAHSLGKNDFFLVAEVMGGDYGQNYYLSALGQNLNAALDLGELKGLLNGLAKGLINAEEYFKSFNPGQGFMGSHRELRNKHVTILDGHDDKVRFSTGASSDHQIAAAIALQLLTLGIPCLYYGSEQAFTGPEEAEWQWLPNWYKREKDVYTREAMFGPEHPRRSGATGLTDYDTELPGFGAFGSCGYHCFDENHPTYMRIASLTALRQKYPELRYGRQYLRPISNFNSSFSNPGAGEIVPWSRILNDVEMLCVLNSNGKDSRGADILIDPHLCPPGSKMTVITNTAEIRASTYNGSYKAGSTVDIKSKPDGTAYIEIRDVKPSEFIVLTNHP